MIRFFRGALCYNHAFLKYSGMEPDKNGLVNALMIFIYVQGQTGFRLVMLRLDEYEVS